MVFSPYCCFNLNTKITKKFDFVWYLVESDGDKSTWRYKSESNILDGIAAYIKLIKYINKKDGDNVY